MNNTPTKSQRVIALILTILFIPMIFGFGIYSVVSDIPGVLESLRTYKARPYMEDPTDKSFFNVFLGRLKSLENELGSNLPFTAQLEYLNADIQCGIGRNLIIQGAQRILRLPGDQLYDTSNRASLAKEAEGIVDVFEYLESRGIPAFFAYVSPQFYNGSMPMPAGYEAVDTSPQLAEEVLGIVRAAGIPTLDSRDFFEGMPYTDHELQLRTDKHWTTLAALLATPHYVEKINELTGASLDASRIALDQFETETYESHFLGTYAERLDDKYVTRDDITLYWPKYETRFTRHEENREGTIVDAEGSFREALIEWDMMEKAEGKDYSMSAYTAYGLIESMEEINNLGDCEDLTVMVLRDSFTAPICRFLSLMTKQVVSFDMRYAEKSVAEYIDQYDPDIVIISYSRMMLEAGDYDFGELR